MGNILNAKGRKVKRKGTQRFVPQQASKGYILLITYYSLLITHYSLLITHYLLLITHYSLLITHYS
jgi:hypothetical protein